MTELPAMSKCIGYKLLSAGPNALHKLNYHTSKTDALHATVIALQPMQQESCSHSGRAHPLVDTDMVRDTALLRRTLLHVLGRLSQA